VWNKQRTDEILLDVDDVALGHTSVMRWNPREQWIFSTEVAHPPIVDMDTFEAAQALLHRRGARGGEHQRHRARHLYVFKCALYCGLCNRKMQAHQTGAGTPRSTPSPTRSTTRATSTCASATWSARSTPRWPARSLRTGSPTR
jgi:hypothetical protein